MTQWTLDGKKVPYQVIIRKAREYGYGDNSTILLTSETTVVLRQHGHKVEYFTEENFVDDTNEPKHNRLR